MWEFKQPTEEYMRTMGTLTGQKPLVPLKMVHFHAIWRSKFTLKGAKNTDINSRPTPVIQTTSPPYVVLEKAFPNGNSVCFDGC